MLTKIANNAKYRLSWITAVYTIRISVTVVSITIERTSETTFANAGRLIPQIYYSGLIGMFTPGK